MSQSILVMGRRDTTNSRIFHQSTRHRYKFQIYRFFHDSAPPLHRSHLVQVIALESWLSLGANLRLLTLCPAKHPPLQTLILDTCHSRFCCRFRKMVSAKRLRAEAAAAAALTPDEKLQAVQDELKKVNAENKEKISEIRKNCLEKKKAIYERRNEIIKGIPDFWLRVFSNHRMLKIVVSPEDREIFGYLDSMCVEYFEDPRKGFSIMLNFMANPFFTNKQLKKTIKFSGEGTIRSKGTSIDWMAGKGPGHVTCMDDNGIQRPFPGYSIFSWICFPEGFEIVLAQDSVAYAIKEDLWPNPMKFLDNVDSESEDEEDEDDDDDEDD